LRAFVIWLSSEYRVDCYDFIYAGEGIKTFPGEQKQASMEACENFDL
jgi:hypothetical protein